jgi:2,3-bisphosphoglycerate-dependent phosphoglycerate mutase
MQVLFEAHATTIDNEAKLASGWNDIALSTLGEHQAAQLGERYRLDELDAVYTADLQRAYRTAQLAFPSIESEKLFLDWRLRECNYGDLTQAPKQQVDADKINRISAPFPNGESYKDTLERMKSFLDDLKLKKFGRVLIIGSRATHYGLDHWINNIPLEVLLTHEFTWQPGWQYEL